MKKYTLGICAFNEGEKIRQVVERFNHHSLYDIIIVDDGSTDGSLKVLPSGLPIQVIRNEKTMGAGYGVRQILQYAKAKGYEAVFFVSGNNKDCPEDIQKLKDAVEAGFDLVQGSRYLPGGQFGNMPLYRKLSTKFMHPFLFSLVTLRRITDSTNGFRAVRLSLLDDRRINIDQDWLDHYELEPYLFFKAIRLGYRVKEVPVKKIYPVKAQGYTKMKPVTGWWSILRPIVFLGLGIKK
jgi:dolichol-phosphate mannosyltransferase